jgi:hypothetical protein
VFKEFDPVNTSVFEIVTKCLTMASNIAKAAAVGALAMNGGGDGVSQQPNNNGGTMLGGMNEHSVNSIVPECPAQPLAHYHHPDVCLSKPARPSQGHTERRLIYDKLRASGTGATLVPNQQTVVCPMQVQSLEIPTATKGFDTTWIVDNTSKNSVVIAWIVNGQEFSPFQPDVKPMDDPKAILKPGDWTSVPTFESFVYHVREIQDDGTPGSILLQHRAGLIPIGNPRDYDCDASSLDVEPFDPDTGAQVVAFQRQKTHPVRPCNTIDVGFRNQVGCPVHMYWANQLSDVPGQGFSCGEKFRFHLGIKPAPQDFFDDWNSMTKFEGTYIGHTFTARLASDPNVVIDSYTLEPTKIVDCPSMKQQVQAVRHGSEAIVEATGAVLPLAEEILQEQSDLTVATPVAARVVGGMSG